MSTRWLLAGLVQTMFGLLSVFPVLAVVMLAIFSMSHMKKNAYLLPVMPAMGTSRRFTIPARGSNTKTTALALLGLADAIAASGAGRPRRSKAPRSTP